MTDWHLAVQIKLNVMRSGILLGVFFFYSFFKIASPFAIFTYSSQVLSLRMSGFRLDFFFIYS